MKNKNIKLGFTTIMHDPRLKYKLSNNDYCIADVIYHLSNNPNGAVIGWCYASRQTLANFFGISRQTVLNSLKTLEDKNLIEINEETRYIRTTKIWYQNFVIYKISTVKNEV